MFHVARLIEFLHVTDGGAALRVALCVFPAKAQTAKDLRGPAAVVPLASEPAPRIVIDPPLAEPLASLFKGYECREYK